jgi:ribosomal protein S18 acetylase RimI-like enzyme
VTPVKVRAARRADAATIGRLAQAFDAEDSSGKPMTRADVLRLGFGPRRLFWVLVAGRGRDIVGYALVFPGYDPGESSAGLHLEELYVRADARGQGVGRALMDAVGRETRRIGGDWITWFVRPRNKVGQAFYRRIGAKRLPSIPMYVTLNGRKLL